MTMGCDHLRVASLTNRDDYLELLMLVSGLNKGVTVGKSDELLSFLAKPLPIRLEFNVRQ